MSSELGGLSLPSEVTLFEVRSANESHTGRYCWVLEKKTSSSFSSNTENFILNSDKCPLSTKGETMILKNVSAQKLLA